MNMNEYDKITILIYHVYYMNFPENIDIIVARYNEDLKWTLEEPFNNFQYIVYNKGENEDFEKTFVKQVIKINNVGRNDHTYLYHIVNNYEKLNDIIIFLPGSVNMEYKKEKAVNLLNRIKNNNFKKAIFIAKYIKKGALIEFFNFKLDKWRASYQQNYIKNSEEILQPARIRPFGKWFLFNFGNIMIKLYQWHGIFSIDKNDVIKHEKIRYERLLFQLQGSSNPEVGHYIERSWPAIFYPFIHTNVLLI